MSASMRYHHSEHIRQAPSSYDSPRGTCHMDGKSSYQDVNAKTVNRWVDEGWE